MEAAARAFEYEAGKRYERTAHDYYVEPRWAVDALFNAERFVGRIVDPACGSGNIVRAAWDRGFVAAGFDVVKRCPIAEQHDFFERHPQHDLIYPTDNIVCNPPYGLAERWVIRALDLANHKVALLLRLAFLESEKRRVMFESTPLARIHVFAKRVSMPPGGLDVPAKGGKTAYGWFVWDLDHQGPPTLHWIEKPEGA